MKKNYFKKKNSKITISAAFSLIVVMLLTGCGTNNVLNLNQKITDFDQKITSFGKKDKSDTDDIDMDEVYKILAEDGYGEGVDWSKQTYVDPSIPKDMDITTSKEELQNAFVKLNPKREEPGDLYDKAWWEFIPDSYDLSGDVFPATNNFAGCDKEYNNSLEQSLIEGYKGYTIGQAHDVSNAEIVARSFMYDEYKNQYNWAADLDELCAIANKLDVADFWYKDCDRPIKKNTPGEYINPTFMEAHYSNRIVDYDLIGLPKYAGYEFKITVWEACDEPVGWIDDFTGQFLNEKETYENMGEWDFYDELDATSKPNKVEAPKTTNGYKILNGERDKLSKEQYIYQKVAGNSGMIYYYGNGITVDMTFYGGEQGGKFENALDYCRIICHNK